MKRLPTLLAALALLAALPPAGATADNPFYGFKSFGVSFSDDQAGGHPDLTVELSQNLNAEGDPFATTRALEFRLPPGIAGNVAAFPKCTAHVLVETKMESTSKSCPVDSQIGTTAVQVSGGGTFVEPVYNMVPASGEVARFGFLAVNIPTLIDVRLDSDREYGLISSLDGLSGLKQISQATTVFWGDPTDPAHDSLRITPYEAFECQGLPCTAPGEEPRHSSLSPVPFLSSPTRCGAPDTATAIATSYAEPANPSIATAPLLPELLGCELLEFKPEISLAPTSAQAESGTGLDVRLDFPQEGLGHLNLLAESHLKRAEVILPEGMTVNPSEAEGLGVCSAADLKRETATSAPNGGCPESAKIGSATAKSPLIDETASGGLYLAKPHDNPFDSLLAIYMVLKIPERGVLVKLAGKVSPDPRTGQLITTFENLPQLPVSSFDLHFREGARAPLVTPPTCGTYTTLARFTPYSDPAHPIATTSSFKVESGPGHGPCPQGTPPFGPGFTAGTLNNDAGSHSPFYMRITRRDGDQDLTKFSATLPPGMVAKLAGTSRCSDQAIAGIAAKTGKQEIASPSCPANSEIGRVLAGAGVGSVLTYVPGKIYLAGPYQGAPLSVVGIVPAVAGPFDVGVVATRQALDLNPRTGVVNVDGSRSDPIPHILAGIPLKVRDIRVYVDRPQFTLNPTSCDPFAVAAELWGGGNDVFSPSDDSPLSLSSRFQAANCAALGFKPKLDLKLKGGTKRGGHPALTGTYMPRARDANLAGLVLRFPHSAFLDQAHIRTICTRVQYAASGGNGAGCPRASIYGRAKAITPLLDQPLEGPVYLRSSSHNLPDFVASLHGLVDIEAVARIDSAKGGIRATFTEVPDAPISKVVVRMQGGRKGLIINSTDLCRGSHRAKAQLEAQNAKRLTLRPEMRAACGGKAKRQRSR
jgi:hypothetical protein